MPSINEYYERKRLGRERMFRLVVWLGFIVFGLCVLGLMVRGCQCSVYH